MRSGAVNTSVKAPRNGRSVLPSRTPRGTPMMNRLIAEKNNPQADVYWANEPIRAEVLRQHGTGTFGLLGVVDGTDSDRGLFLEILEDGFGKHLVVAHIDDNRWRLRSRDKSPGSKR